MRALPRTGAVFAAFMMIVFALAVSAQEPA